jgi:hypothetical protein
LNCSYEIVQRKLEGKIYQLKTELCQKDAIIANCRCRHQQACSSLMTSINDRVTLCADIPASTAQAHSKIFTNPSPFYSQNRTVRTYHRTPDAQRWCSRLAMDMGEGQKQARCSDSPVRRRGDAECSNNGGAEDCIHYVRKI